MNGRVLRLCDESSRNLAVGAVSLSSRTNRNGTTYLLKSPKGRLLYFAIANDGRRYKKCDHMRAWAAQGQARVDKDFHVR